MASSYVVFRKTKCSAGKGGTGVSGKAFALQAGGPRFNLWHLQLPRSGRR